MGTITTLIEKVNTNIINPLLLLLFFSAFVVFLYGTVRYLAQAENDEARRTGARHMLWGVVGMFIMVGVFGIIAVIKRTLNL